MCTSCSQKYSSVYSQQQRPRTVIVNQEDITCDYTIPMLTAWQSKLECAKESGIYNDLNIDLNYLNAFLGIVKSALSNSSKICYFKSHLDSFSPTIVKIVNSGAC